MECTLAKKYKVTKFYDYEKCKDSDDKKIYGMNIEG